MNVIGLVVLYRRFMVVPIPALKIGYFNPKAYVSLLADESRHVGSEPD